jgi:hypothetical protein
VSDVKTIFYIHDIFQDKADCKRVAVIVQLVWLVGCGLDRVSEVSFQAVSRDFSLLLGFQSKSVAYPASCSVGTEVIFPKGKAGGV